MPDLRSRFKHDRLFASSAEGIPGTRMANSILASASVQGSNPRHSESLCLSRDTATHPTAVTPQRRKHARCMRWMISDTQTDMLLGEPKSAICVQRFDDSLNSAIHTTYRSWLRSSSMREPRDPPSKVVSRFSLSVTTRRPHNQTVTRTL